MKNKSEKNARKIIDGNNNWKIAKFSMSADFFWLFFFDWDADSTSSAPRLFGLQFKCGSRKKKYVAKYVKNINYEKMVCNNK